MGTPGGATVGLTGRGRTRQRGVPSGAPCSRVIASCAGVVTAARWTMGAKMAKTPVPSGPSLSERRGEPLSEPVRTRMEDAFGADFRSVRIDQSREALPFDAHAYTRGDTIRFARGHYDPSSTRGLELIGHELAHVVRQRQDRVGGGFSLGGAKVNADAGLEREADALGRAAVSGRSVSVGHVPDAASSQASADVIQMKSPHIVGTPNSTSVKHPISVLNDNLKTQLGDYPYPIQNGAQVRPSEFIKSSKKIYDAVDRPNSIHVVVEGTRRTPSSRQAAAPQTEIGNIGEHERAMFDRPVTAKFNYAGGHLVSDKILGQDSYRADNLAPQLRDFNSPAWRVMEIMAEKGPYDTVNKRFDTSVPIDMKVAVEYADQDYTVKVADLAAWSVIPSTVTQTDGGAKTMTIPRRVPHVWKAELAVDSTKFPNHVLKEDAVPPVPSKHFVGLDTAVLDPVANPSLKSQPEEGFVFGQSSATSFGTGFRVGGKATEKVVAVQAYPQDKASQPTVGGGSVIKPSAPPVNPTFLSLPIDISDFWIPQKASASKKRSREDAFDELESKTDKRFRQTFESAVQYYPVPKTRAEFGTILRSKRVAKRKKDAQIAKQLQIDTNILNLT
ncbi:DUF4157 domain-containing protein [Corallococcus sp. CA053C]|nr:DUF4157 domain-containing protein [Corallococcus sp. CA053C]